MPRRKRTRRRSTVVDDDDEDDDDDGVSMSMNNAQLKSKYMRTSWKKQYIEDREEKKLSRLMAETELWTDKHAPIQSIDLCVHTKKLAEIRDWLVHNCVSAVTDRRILILLGPPGCAKSSTLRTLCNEQNISVASWSEETDFSQHRFQHGFHVDDCFEYHLPYESKIQKFADFFTRAQRYRSLPLINSSNTSSSSDGVRRLILVEEMPFVDKPNLMAQFRELVQRIARSARCAVVFVFSFDHENRSAAYRSFGPELLASNIIQEIRMNRISATGMRKALRRVAMNESININADQIEDFIRVSNGDVRAAIHSMQFQSIATINTKKENHQESHNSKSSLLRDSTLSIYHSLGKILYAKEIENPETVIVASGISHPLFLDHLHENAYRFLDASPDALDSYLQVSLAFSDGDLLRRAAFSNYEQMPSNIASSIACRAYVQAKLGSTTAINNSWRPMYAPEGRTSVEQGLHNREQAHILFFDPLIRKTFPFTVNCMSSTNQFIDIFPYLAVLYKIGAHFPSLPEAFTHLVWKLSEYSAPGIALSRGKTFDDRGQENVVATPTSTLLHRRKSSRSVQTRLLLPSLNTDEQEVLMEDCIEQF